MKFESGYIEPRSRNEQDYAFVFSGADMLVRKDLVPALGGVSDLLYDSASQTAEDGLYFGRIGDRLCYAFSIPADISREDSESWDGYESDVHRFVLLRRYISELDSAVMRGRRIRLSSASLAHSQRVLRKMRSEE